MMVLAEASSPLDGLASAASVLLIIEVSLIVILFAALALLLAFSFKWLHDHAIPPVRAALPSVKGALSTTDRVTGQIIDVVADLYGRRKGFEETVRAFASAFFPELFDHAGDKQDAEASPSAQPSSSADAPTMPHQAARPDHWPEDDPTVPHHPWPEDAGPHA
jgi:hypothetical protein